MSFIYAGCSSKTMKLCYFFQSFKSSIARIFCFCHKFGFLPEPIHRILRKLSNSALCSCRLVFLLILSSLCRTDVVLSHVLFTFRQVCLFSQQNEFDFPCRLWLLSKFWSISNVDVAVIDVSNLIIIRNF